jgi:anthranilate synthase component 1
VWTQQDYQQRIDEILKYIRSGDVYQVNLTMPFQGQCSSRNQDVSIYLQLREYSPAPYAAFFRRAGHSIISHSPERFLSAHQQHCSSHPIKGTRKRIAGHEQSIRNELLHAEKDRAELDMIMDLVRNDLGRIAEPGSVHVDNARTLLDLPYVHHAAGHISCRLQSDCRHRDLFSACFPAGSITGAPKIRAMEIISELEALPRGAYCGCFGWLGADYRCELAVAIRTMQLDDQQIRIDAGGGIVIDSQAPSEWLELNDKASAMQQSLGLQQCQ